MQIIDLFSGVGGFSIAGHQLGWETILFCEKEPFPQLVLKERFPGVPIFDDVCKLTGETINGLIQSDRPIIITGGFPCQPFSVAGAREGTEDSRHLWPEMFRIIQAVRPDYIIGENVPGLLSIEGGLVFEQVCLDLESEGYEVQAFVLPACATGAPHRRDRVWIVAHSNEVRRGSGFGSISEANGEVSQRHKNAESCDTGSGDDANSEEIICRRGSNANGNSEERQICEDIPENGNGVRSESEGCCGITPDTGIQGHQGSEQPGTHGERPEQSKPHRPVTELHSGNYWAEWPSISPFHSGYDGLSEDLVRHIRTSLEQAGQTPEQIEAYLRKESNWLRKESIKCAGNAIVPQVVLQVMKAIENHYDLPRPNSKNPSRTEATQINSGGNG
jgi:DNA (cytosine-5)-methyltransferase 1